jgi:hypothetical protein
MTVAMETVTIQIKYNGRPRTTKCCSSAFTATITVPYYRYTTDRYYCNVKR